MFDKRDTLTEDDDVLSFSPALPRASTSAIDMRDVFGTIVIRNERDQIDTNRMAELGFPTSLARSKVPTSHTQASGSVLPSLQRRRIHTTVLRSVLRHDSISRAPEPRTVEELLARRQKNKGLANRVSTLFDSMFDDLIAVRTRVKTASAMYNLFHIESAREATLFYNPNRGDDGDQVKASDSNGFAVRWATLVLEEPDEAQDRWSANISKDEMKDRNKAFFAKLEAREQDDGEYLKELNVPPSERHAELLSTMLVQLERYGSIWARAGHSIRPSMHNRDPRQRAKFAVLGLFPEPLLKFCATHLGVQGDKDKTLQSQDSAVQLFVQYFAGWRAQAYEEPRSQGRNFAYGQYGVAAVG